MKSKYNKHKEEKCCDNCLFQETGWDGGFFGEPVTCDCRFYGVTENRDNCDKFQRRITISEKVAMLEKEITELKEENKQLKTQNLIYDAFKSYVDPYDKMLCWEMFCGLEKGETCPNDENKDCKYCKHLKYKQRGE